MHFWLGSIEEGIYPRILSVIFVCVVLFPVLAIKKKITFEKIVFDSRTQKILLISIILFLWEIFVNQVVHTQSFNLLIASTAKVLIFILLGMFIYLVIENKEYFEKYLFIILLLVATSALIGFLQFLDISWAWQLREIQGPILYKAEPAGLALLTLHLSYQLGCTLPLALAMVMSRTSHPKKRLFYICALAIIALGLIVTTVRSAILGALVGSLLTVFMIREYKKALMLLLPLIIFALFIFSSVDISSLKPIVTFSDESASARLPLFVSALNIAKDNPFFGLGSGGFQKVAESYYGYVYQMRGAHAIAITGPHNQFLNTLVYFGIPGLLLLFIFYFTLLKRLIFTQKTSCDKYYQYISAGLLGAFISYIINSLFHNTGPFLSDPYNWFFIGAAFVIFKLHNRSEPQPEQSPSYLKKE